MPREPLKNILLVEDDSDMQYLAMLALSQVGGFKVNVCSNGYEALEIVNKAHPQMILLDVMMPELDGPATLQKLRMNPATANIPIVFLTASTQEKDIERYKKLGALDIIPKPINPVTISQHLLDIWKKA
jgi:two-component system OmpR family response regulator